MDTIVEKRITRLPARAVELLRGKNFGNLATIMPDGSPQVTPVWVDTDGQHVIINTAKGRRKYRNLRQTDRVAIDVLDQDNPYSYVQIRGHVAEMTTDGAVDMINRLSEKYTGNPQYPLRPGEERVTVRIVAEHVDVS